MWGGRNIWILRRDLILSTFPCPNSFPSGLMGEFKKRIMLWKWQILWCHYAPEASASKETGTCGETATLKKRFQFPFMPKQGVIMCDAVSLLPQGEHSREPKSREWRKFLLNVRRDFPKPTLIISCGYGAVCASQTSTSLIVITRDKKRMHLCTPTRQRNWEQHGLQGEKPGWVTDTKKWKWLLRWELRWAVGGAEEICIAWLKPTGHHQLT